MKKVSRLTVTIIALSIFSLGGSAEAATTKSDSEPTYIVRAEAEKRIREYFKDTPVMIEIARCESNFRQYTDAGTVLRGGASGGMIGAFQFFESIHTVPAKALGFDITTLEGNLAYARHVYTTEGTTPWNPAKHCWGVTTVTPQVKLSNAELRLKIKQLTELITLLQKLQTRKVKRL